MSLANSKAGSKSDQKSSSTATASTPTTPSKSAIKQLPGKLAKKVKRQFRRLDGVLQHVIHPHPTPSFSVTSPSSPIFYPIGVVRAFLPPDQSSASSDTLDVEYAKEVDSIEPTDSLANHSIDSDMSVDSSTTHDMSDELHLPQEEPHLNFHQGTSASDPAVTSSVEPETPDPFLIDDDDDDDDDDEDSEEEADEEKAPSDANSSNVVSPTQAVSLDLSPLLEASIPQPQGSLPNLQKDIPPSESEEEYVPDLYVPALIVPTMFLPIPNVRRSFSSNLLTWWLARNLMYDNCTRPIL